ncbi:aspartate kinase [Pseudothermotoga thermarum]|uniref:Aspartokinase n=1 Tax=Pseudothermotoga thermarum DSM 5069 TaxID=688269 RepID=F7YXH8_9THEM|nr:aspartate kinase [Pseudothermotoga thermarum]AEH50619.1 aspartate kinase [Pseudothermotoga thermarum DSM 5069]
MKSVVLKFGGSNLKTKEDLEKILTVVKMYQDPMVIVVSAIYGVTNQLIDLLRKPSSINTQEFLNYLYSLYKGFLGYDDEELKQRVFDIENYLEAVKLMNKVPDFVYDLVISHGERCSSLMLTKWLNQNGIECQEALPEKIGLVTDGKFRNASIDLEASRENLKKALEPGKNYVVPGFYGIHEDFVTILGRGGSDYTATAIAYCIDAKRVDLYKDVPGFMTCDPKYVKGVKPVKMLNYDEAAELSYFGAKILHHASVDPLRKKSIPLYIFNINNFVSIDQPDTIISANGSCTNRIIKSISFTDDIAVIQFKGTNVGRVPGILGQIASIFGNEGLNIKSVVTSQTSINFLISRQDIEKCKKITSKINVPEIEEINYKTDISLIAVVGNGILQKHGIAARVFTAVSKKNINVEMISAGASDVTMYFIVNITDRNAALQAIHDEFFGKGDEDEND